MNMEFIIGGVLAALMLLYLIYTLRHPERF